jgi:hypothetical protein
MFFFDPDMRKQFVLDKRTNQLLEKLASCRGGNRSLVVRQAIQVFADMEDRLERIEDDPGFDAMMRESDKAIRERRVTSHKHVIKMLRKRAKRKNWGVPLG